ncbi:hypothetical protein [Paraeggerthella sp.]|uniref:hypothetical protein n=1 Tax=Paraeggerthella sp. TaxID=2897350 RepID=UPI0035299C52
MSLPQGVERVASAAFADGCEPPAVVDCSAALARVDARGWDDAVWKCPAEAPAYRALRKRGVRLAGPFAVELDGCWYDFDDEGAVLVAGPPKPVSVSRRFAEQAAVRAVAVRGADEAAAAAARELSPSAAAAEAATEFAASGEAGSTVDYVSASASDILALPRQVEGRPLVRIGVRALPFAPALGGGSRHGARHRARQTRAAERSAWSCPKVCAPSARIASGRANWKAPFPFRQVAARWARAASSIRCADCRIRELSCMFPLTSCSVVFWWTLPTAFRSTSRATTSCCDRGRTCRIVWGALLHRLASPYRLSDSVRAVLVSHLRGYGKEAWERVAREGDRDMVEALVEAGFIDEASFDRQIELLRSCNRTDCVAYLMEWRREQRASEASAPLFVARSVRAVRKRAKGDFTSPSCRFCPCRAIRLRRDEGWYTGSPNGTNAARGAR